MMKILVLNSGSSSIKYKLFEMPECASLAAGIIQRIGEESSIIKQESANGEVKFEQPIKNHEEGLELIQSLLTQNDHAIIQTLDEIDACGHRIVHGGESISGSVLIDDQVETIIEEYFDLAPLHNPPNLIGVRAAKKFLTNVPHIACFDTAFHQTLTPIAYMYALPYEFYQKFKIRKYGFHGTSHLYVARRAAKLLNIPMEQVKLITCHLGNGCSITAVEHGKSVDTSMGLTPLEGLIMGTRTGDFDPAIVFHLIRKGYRAEELDVIANKRSGLLGISGISNDVRDLVNKAETGHERARLALEMFCYRLKKYIGSYLAVLNGCDGIVFTGGIGENASILREWTIANISALGITLDHQKNDEAGSNERFINSPDSKIKIMVIPTNEEIAIALETYDIMTKGN
ncbi:acetate kinase [candidate division KSB1 bacterium]|nr:acetate kinase [candidate division KSB1 bacterium]